MPRLETFDCYRITIRDEDTGDFYEAVWQTYSMEEMEKRYKEALGKIIIGEIEIFNPDKETIRDVVLRDFIIEEHFKKKSENLSETEMSSQLTNLNINNRTTEMEHTGPHSDLDGENDDSSAESVQIQLDGMPLPRQFNFQKNADGLDLEEEDNNVEDDIDSSGRVSFNDSRDLSNDLTSSDGCYDGSVSGNLPLSNDNLDFEKENSQDGTQSSERNSGKKRKRSSDTESEESQENREETNSRKKRPSLLGRLKAFIGFSSNQD